MKIALDENKQPEIFYSIQGEGPFSGRPSVFLRLSECNLYCQWCDTPYTWNWRGTAYSHKSVHKYIRREEQQRLDCARLLALIKTLPGKNVVVSGGEPLVQQRQLQALLTLLSQADSAYQVDVETNGTIRPVAGLDRLIACYVVSPKLANAGMPAAKRLRPAALRWFAKSDKAYFKFVVNSEADMEEVHALISQHHIAKAKSYLMPVADSAATLDTMQAKVSTWAMRSGVKYSDRLHLRLFGQQRGV